MVRRKSVWAGVVIVVAVVILVALPDVAIVAQIRRVVVEVVTTTSGPVILPFQSLRSQWRAFREARDLQDRVLHLRMENQALREEVERLRRQLEKERFMRMMAGGGLPHGSRAALVLWRLPGYPVHRFLVDAGTLEGVVKGAGVITDGAVVGIVGTPGRHRSLVFSVLDHSFRAAGQLETSGTVGLAQGTSDRLTLRYIPSETLVHPGERVLTSGDDGIFPPGYILGYVRSRETEGQSYHTLTLEPAFPTLGLRVVVILPYTPDVSLTSDHTSGEKE
ncbi:MAG: rod shape-determining protein MreC [bacterium JZ-2024 1]